MDEIQFDESDCCGNGCANCVLDEKPKRKRSIERGSKPNILEKYTEFRLKRKAAHANLSDVLELHFESVVEGKTDFILTVPSGHHLMMKAPVLVTESGKSKNLLRPYSPFWVDAINLEFKILVNLKPNGPMSKYIRELKEEEDKVEFRGPIGGLFEHKATAEAKKMVCIISQGVAVAPTLRIIDEILQDEDDMTIVTHFACFLDLDHAYFRQKLHECESYWNYSLYMYLSRQKCEDELEECGNTCQCLSKKLLYKEKAFARRLTGEELRRNLKAGCGEEASFIIAGSRTFQDQITLILKNEKIGANDENIFLL